MNVFWTYGRQFSSLSSKKLGWRDAGYKVFTVAAGLLFLEDSSSNSLTLSDMRWGRLKLDILVLLRRSPNSAYFLVLNDRKIRHFVIILQADTHCFMAGSVSRSA